MRKGLIKRIIGFPIAAIVILNFGECVVTEYKLNKLYWKDKQAAHNEAESMTKDIPPKDYLFKGGEILAAYKYHHAIENGWFKRFSSP